MAPWLCSSDRPWCPCPDLKSFPREKSWQLAVSVAGKLHLEYLIAFFEVMGAPCKSFIFGISLRKHPAIGAPFYLFILVSTICNTFSRHSAASPFIYSVRVVEKNNHDRFVQIEPYRQRARIYLGCCQPWMNKRPLIGGCHQIVM